MTRLGSHRKKFRISKAKGCDNKRPFGTREEANARRQKYIDGGAPPEGIRVYKCPHCNKFHVGHKYN